MLTGIYGNRFLFIIARRQLPIFHPDLIRFRHALHISVPVYRADTASHAAVLAQRIGKNKSCHADIINRRIHVHFRCHILIQLYKRLFAIIVICIDHDKRFLHDILHAKDRLSGSPRFRSSPGILPTSREFIHRLVCILDRNQLLDPLSDNLLKILLDILADNKDNLIASRFQRIMDRIIHNNLSIRPNRFQLFNSAAKTTADSGGHNDKCYILHFVMFLLIHSLYAKAASGHNCPLAANFPYLSFSVSIAIIFIAGKTIGIMPGCVVKVDT